MRILIAGAGIAGLAAALALARKGHDVQLIEQAPALEEVGAGLQLGPNAMRMLDALGIGEKVAAAGQSPA
ncbi:FAD-dependent oxidoreductase, partial [Blastomonas sp. UPD001]|uniref:FAD-dependent oxidoreductase n=1 Tax=Blastomonas sp. UPD001 TaxID=2217673 RepID=UPI000E34CB19